ncbi:branched-chain amino acid ABC transporter permease [Ochrobactrum soli]|uniref:branched-chain amino acid ABC transporter permease n=1 Tax=Ochrobactrum soli TaxID=2448455 RepID=UPI000EF222BC|nr:branched-chain amino acid ABC transporter permease [[Ochrobactrum] soli]RLL64647.1 branched-chain amino acid ABC transporter permease [[Ochrobactrum] soli]
MSLLPKLTPGRVSFARELTGFFAVCAILLVSPLFMADSYSRHILILALIYGVVASNWDLSLGYGGIFNFGHLALFGIGAYAYALLTTLAGVDPWLAMLLSGIAASVAALLVTIPILRLKGIYIVLVTFGFAQLVMQFILSQSQITGGSQGMVRLPSVYFAGHNFIRDGKLGYFLVALALFVASTLFLRVLVRSRIGAAIVALRDNEEYAISRGISLVRVRALTLASSALFTGIAGAFYASYQRSVSLDVFGMSLATIVLSMVLLGGTSTIYGPICASFLLTWLAELMVDLGAWRPIVTGLLILIIVLAFPRGLAGMGASIAARFAVHRRRGGESAATKAVASA